MRIKYLILAILVLLAALTIGTGGHLSIGIGATGDGGHYIGACVAQLSAVVTVDNGVHVWVAVVESHVIINQWIIGG